MVALFEFDKLEAAERSHSNREVEQEIRLNLWGARRPAIAAWDSMYCWDSWCVDFASDASDELWTQELDMAERYDAMGARRCRGQQRTPADVRTKKPHGYGLRTRKPHASGIRRRVQTSNSQPELLWSRLVSKLIDQSSEVCSSACHQRRQKAAQRREAKALKVYRQDRGFPIAEQPEVEADYCETLPVVHRERRWRCLPAMATEGGCMARWALLIRKLQQVTCPRGRATASAPSRKLAAGPHLQRWAHLHAGLPVPAVAALALADDKQCIPFTLAHQVWAAEQAQLRREAKLGEQRWLAKWQGWTARKLVEKLFRSWRVGYPVARAARVQQTAKAKERAAFEVRRLAATANKRAVAAARTRASDVVPPHSSTSGNARTAAASQNEAAQAEALGLDVATLQLLRALEHRDIVPEDYELLGRLDENVAAPTLTPEQLRRFPSEVYQIAAPGSQRVPAHEPPTQVSATAFGPDYWRLPLQLDESDEEVPVHSGVALPAKVPAHWGMDYWRLPLCDCDVHSLSSTEGLGAEGEDIATGTEESSERSSGSSSSSSGSSSEDGLCAICYVPFEDGDVTRRLQPCGHRFHKPCIDRWLLEKSKRCPVDNLELVLD